MATNVDDICAICQEPLKESWWQWIKRNLKGESQIVFLLQYYPIGHNCC